MIQMQQQKQSSNSQIVLICLNPKCKQPTQRCLDNHTIRTHPSQCSHHYFLADSICKTKWTELQDYPNDALGLSIKRKLNQFGVDVQNKSKFKNNKDKQTQKQASYLPLSIKIMQNFKDRLRKAIDMFSLKFQQYMSSTMLQDFYTQTYCLDPVRRFIKQNSPQLITKCLNRNFSKNCYGQLAQINAKIQNVMQSLQDILTGVKTSLRNLFDSVSKKTKKQAQKFESNTQTIPQRFSYEQQKSKPKIQFGLTKSKFITSSKILYEKGQVIFPKLENINVASFLPWVYGEKGFTQGTHQLRITSMKFPTIQNSGFTVLQEHDIDTYPYTYFKSLFSKDGKGFKLITNSQQYDQFQLDMALNTPNNISVDNSKLSRQDRNKQKDKKSMYSKTGQSSKIYTEMQHTIGQISQVILRLQLNNKPRAIIRNIQGNSIYICQLQESKKYRMGLYGGGWKIVVNQLY